MANIIAVVWDFDKTLVNGYMEEPIFEHYGVDSSVFWREVNSLPEKYRVEQGVRVNPDTIYLNHFIHYAKKGIFKGLNNAMLYDFGKNLHFYEGVPEIFEETRKLIEEDSIYQEYDIKVEHYIVSTGLSQVIKGSVVVQYVKGIWGCELIEEEIENGEKIISEIGYTIDNTSKTRDLKIASRLKIFIVRSIFILASCRNRHRTHQMKKNNVLFSSLLYAIFFKKSNI